MRFRVTHLLIATAVLALFALALGTLSPESVTYIRLGAFIVYGLMAVRAIARPGLERVVFASMLVIGLPYFCWTLTLDEFGGPRFITSILMDKVFGGGANWFSSPEDFAYYRWLGLQVGHVALSFAFGCMGGLLGWYWYKSADEKSKI